nr:hemerythrin domain-containing protein [uncultured Oscillibacter sp.]
MDDQRVWKEEYNIGVEIIDKEHQRLFKIIDKLLAVHQEEQEEKSRWACQEGIKYFKGHALKHFEDEEKYMETVNYTGRGRHRSIHENFKNNILPALESELRQTDFSQDAMSHFLAVCSGWLIGHTLTEDMAIVGGKVSKWENLLPADQVMVIQKALIQQLFNMFHLEAQMISDAYGGERFGRGVYCLLVYGDSRNPQKQDVVMALEESMLINTVGKAMGLKTNRLDTMLLNAARHTTRQFVGRLLEHFPEWDSCDVTEEKLLTYEQFRQIFEKKKPQVSLLFNTGVGYCSFSIIAPHMLEEDIVGTPIQEDNALIEVEHYLQEQERAASSNRKKILVVDDSATIRNAMSQLLRNDYEVSLADSGVAAIRAITLDRPDLVLLDYEMPVCDGRQTLEMLRSEKSFAEIPVIFLTGQGDPEVVKKLLSLKPAGYLLKYLKAGDIKKKIDDFFAKKKS